MSVCTFFGHSDCPSTVAPMLRSVLIELIENHGVDVFYVGNQGNFDRMVRSALKELAEIHPHIRYAVVLAYMPGKRDALTDFDYKNTTFPEGIEAVHPRFALLWRNKWMIRQADYVVTYITHSWGGAAQFADLAEKQRKVIINLAP